MRVCPRCKSIYSVPVDRCGIDGTAIVEQEDDPLVGYEIDRYRITEPLGRGAMGAVYSAHHSVLENKVAIKVLYGNFALNQRLIERFRREAQAIGKMRHPNIVDVLDFGRTPEGLTFLVMELVDGRTLEEAIEDEAPFSPVRAAQIARQIASGLGEAHRRGFVHRDMKPSNVMLSAKGELEMVKILDFGVVGLIQAAAAAKLTAVGHIVGTPTYMAPEQARSSTVTPAADLYALGVILYEMLSGRPPFEGQGIAEVLLMHLNQNPDPLPEAKGLEKIVAQLLEKRTEKRLPSAARVLAEIDRLNLKIANTEQILVSNVLEMAGAEKLPDGEYSETIEVQTQRNELPRKPSELPMPKVEHDSTDPAIGVAEGQRDDTDRSAVVDAPREKGVVKDPSDEDRPRLVAPSMSGLSVSPVPESALDAPTQLDFRVVSRPGIEKGRAQLFSVSSADTAPPEEEEEENDTDNLPKNVAAEIAELTVPEPLDEEEPIPMPRVSSGPRAPAAPVPATRPSSGPRMLAKTELIAPDVPVTADLPNQPAAYFAPTYIPLSKTERDVPLGSPETQPAKPRERPDTPTAGRMTVEPRQPQPTLRLGNNAPDETDRFKIFALVLIGVLAAVIAGAWLWWLWVNGTGTR